MNLHTNLDLTSLLPPKTYYLHCISLISGFFSSRHVFFSQFRPTHSAYHAACVGLSLFNTLQPATPTKLTISTHKKDSLRNPRRSCLKPLPETYLYILFLSLILRFFIPRQLNYHRLMMNSRKEFLHHFFSL